MRAHKSFLLLCGVVALAAHLAVSATTVAAQGDGSPCRGKSLSLHRLQAQRVGVSTRGSSKVILNVETNEQGIPIGTLVFNRGPERFEITEWCRLWMSDEEIESTTSAHVMGYWTSPHGVRHLMRVDIRVSDTPEFRFRSRPLEHQSAGDEHSGWTSLSGEGWLTLTRARNGSVGTQLKWMNYEKK